MDAMRSLTVIPQQVISNLPLLQLVSMYKGYHSTVIIEDDIWFEGCQKMLELEGLASLNNLSIFLFTATWVVKLKISHKLERSLRPLVDLVKARRGTYPH